MYEFDRIVDRKGTDSIKWDLVESKFGNASALPLWVADMDFESPPQLVDAIGKRALHPSYGYTFASENYYKNFIEWNKKRNGYSIAREEILSVPGIVCAFSFIIYSLVGSGGKIMLNTPIYDPFFNVTHEQGCEVIASSLILRGGRYEMDWDDMENKMAEGVDLFVLCNPHNPTGRVWSREELERVSHLCLKHKIPLFTDDIHSDLVLEGHRYTSLLAFGEAIRQNTILATAPSKTFNIAGLKSSYLVIPNKEIRQKIATALGNFHVGVNLFGMKAAEIAYEVGEDWLEALNIYLKQNAEYVVDFCEKKLPLVKSYVPEGTYLMWLDFSAYNLSQEDLMKRLVHGAGVALNDGSHYGYEGVGFARLNIGTSRSMLEDALEAIERAFG